MTHYFDNTRVSSFRECPRKFYFRHMRHWRGEGISKDLAFGLAWHSAMDVVWNLMSSKSDDELLAVAMASFDKTWTDEGFPSITEMDLTKEQELSPKTPGIAMEMLYHYIRQRRARIEEVELLGCERPFIVPIPHFDDVHYIGRKDKEFRWQGRIYIGEHKTTSDYSKDHGIQPRYAEQYYINGQTDGYLFAGHVEHGADMGGVWIDAALCHKKVHDCFKIIPLDKQLQQVESWLADQTHWIGEILRQTQRLREGGHTNSVLYAFPKNANSCIDRYGKKCPYHDICRFKGNPELIEEPPDGLIVDKWQPFNILKIEQLGAAPEEDL